MENIKLHNQDNAEGMKIIPDGSIDVICTDPPYLYLKNQKLEREFDEFNFFKECMRVLKPGGFIVLFGRGTSFYRWNYILSGLGFEFKEEIVWNKSQSSSPLMPLSRVHETISIHCKGKGKVNRVKVPYMEMKGHDLEGVIQDVKRLKSVLNNPKSLKDVNAYLEDKYKPIDVYRAGVTIRGSSLMDSDRSVGVLKMFDTGMNEKSIIKQVRDHYSSIHPTQKPVRLLERLLSLVIKAESNATILDPFAGSASTAEACYNMGVNFIGYEIDKEYYDLASNRLAEIYKSESNKIS